jgi:hypothetical protein
VLAWHVWPSARQLAASLRRLPAILTFVLVFAASARGQPDLERAKIDYLIDSIAQLHDAVFIRNGTDYTSAQAADHLRLKLRNAGARVRTAEDFITRCATGSSASGEKYRIRFADGRIVDNAVFLRQKLAEFGGPG